MNPLNRRNLLLSPDAATEGAPDNAAPAVDFSAMDAASTATIAPANGTHLCVLRGFEPVINQEYGRVEQWKFTLEAAEPIPDNQKPPGVIPEGSRLGTFSVFVAPSQYRSLDECVVEVKKISQALNGIVRDTRADLGFKKADAAWAALPPQAKRPAFTGTPPVLDSELEWYGQHVNTLVLATLSTRVGKDGLERTNLVGLLAKDAPRASKGHK